MFLINFVNKIGESTIRTCTALGEFSVFFLEAAKTLFTTRLRFKKLFYQMEHIGVNSLNIVILTGTFAGAVLAIQSYTGFKRFGAEGYLGPIVALSLTRELGPVLAALMVTGRAGSSITAELATMSITEQIDALRTLCINTFQYLVIPRILASTIILPLLTLFAMICGIAGGYVICVYVLSLNGEQYITEIQSYIELRDIVGGLIKAAVFGFIFSLVGTYKGYTTRGGARGVGLSTTKSVVISSILILISNYFLAILIFGE
ncbi:ABC transporter permease [bacterium]|nr:ABC transporter permease [bacterium]